MGYKPMLETAIRGQAARATRMTASLRALLTNVIDYAGLFPPASLDLETSYRNFRAYLESPDRWMLGRFICPIDKLAALTDLILANPPTQPVEYCVLGRAGDDPEDHAVHTAASAGMVPVLRAQEHVKFGAIEMPAAPESIAPKLVATKIAKSLPDTYLYFEIAWSGDWRARWTAAIAAIKPVESLVGGIGLKLRTGGVTADAFPPAEVVAGVIDLCRRERVRLKFTAGLHHPIRLFHDSVQAKMHGFVNVFVAAVLAHVHGMDEHGIRLILETESPADFTFDDYGLAWKTLRASNQRIEQVRKHSAISFGSCSFDEPREDLGALGWM